ncbi:unnamed protein product [Albugo candida]|uniref:Uncharacterized protein n=1 Tax=Albugo candida TaxID=65357 RepID=A0A024GSG8_9STRA|nr:unnamed protein product [Albugo candida]|eukprot:CCI49859.1 unnamed protein product [Albugo candida]
MSTYSKSKVRVPVAAVPNLRSETFATDHFVLTHFVQTLSARGNRTFGDFCIRGIPFVSKCNIRFESIAPLVVVGSTRSDVSDAFPVTREIVGRSQFLLSSAWKAAYVQLDLEKLSELMSPRIVPLRSFLAPF